MQHIIDRFLKYVSFDSQSNADSSTTPSTEKQWEIARYITDELKRIGMQDVSLDDNAYIMASLPSNIDRKVPVIGFISHFDTSPDYTATNVKPQIHKNYDGKDIVLNKEQNNNEQPLQLRPTPVSKEMMERLNNGSTEKEKKEFTSTIQNRAEAASSEGLDDVKLMNKMVAYAKAATIREKQLD